MTEPYDLQAIQRALATWAESSTGATAVFLYDGGPQPARPFVGLYVMGLSTPDQPERTHTYSGAAALGQEITIHYREQRSLRVQVSTYTDTARKASAAGTATALQLLENMLGEASTVARNSAFRAAGIALAHKGKVHRRPFQEGTTWVDCALTEVVFNLAAVVTEQIGYIDTVELYGEVDEVDIDSTVSLD